MKLLCYSETMHEIVRIIVDVIRRVQCPLRYFFLFSWRLPSASFSVLCPLFVVYSNQCRSFIILPVFPFDASNCSLTSEPFFGFAQSFYCGLLFFFFFFVVNSIIVFRFHYFFINFNTAKATNKPKRTNLSLCIIQRQKIVVLVF